MFRLNRATPTMQVRDGVWHGREHWNGDPAMRGIRGGGGAHLHVCAGDHKRSSCREGSGERRREERGSMDIDRQGGGQAVQAMAITVSCTIVNLL